VGHLTSVTGERPPEQPEAEDRGANRKVKTRPQMRCCVILIENTHSPPAALCIACPTRIGDWTFHTVLRSTQLQKADVPWSSALGHSLFFGAGGWTMDTLRRDRA
jgi:hypothetical protein